MKAVRLAAFSAHLYPTLKGLVYLLYARHRGDPLAAVQELGLMCSHWAADADEHMRHIADGELLRTQGK